jgi:hydroxymethylpyrimidine pyrophosphatase-like HAD family hydrolase
MFDVDDTLIMHDKVDPCTVYVTIVNPYDDKEYSYTINANMLKILTEEHARGHTIVVWSRRGWKWAEAVVIALNIFHIVTLVMDKPTVYFDDKPVEDWMKDRVYIGPNEIYK